MQIRDLKKGDRFILNRTSEELIYIDDLSRSNQHKNRHFVMYINDGRISDLHYSCRVKKTKGIEAC